MNKLIVRVSNCARSLGIGTQPRGFSGYGGTDREAHASPVCDHRHVCRCVAAEP